MRSQGPAALLELLGWQPAAGFKDVAPVPCFRESPATQGIPHDLHVQSCWAGLSLRRKNTGWERKGRKEENQQEEGGRERADGRAGEGAAFGAQTRRTSCLVGGEAGQGTGDCPHWGRPHSAPPSAPNGS